MCVCGGCKLGILDIIQPRVCHWLCQCFSNRVPASIAASNSLSSVRGQIVARASRSRPADGTYLGRIQPRGWRDLHWQSQWHPLGSRCPILKHVLAVFE